MIKIAHARAIKTITAVVFCLKLFLFTNNIEPPPPPAPLPHVINTMSRVVSNYLSTIVCINKKKKRKYFVFAKDNFAQTHHTQMSRVVQNRLC